MRRGVNLFNSMSKNDSSDVFRQCTYCTYPMYLRKYVVLIRVPYNRILKKETNFEITAFLNYEQGT